MTKDKIRLILVLIFIYIVLFEFILPINKLLPKPSLLAESIIVVWSDYNFFESLAWTTTVIYLSILFSFIIIHFVSPYLIKLELELPALLESLKIFRYFPAFFFAIIFVFWFGESLFAELLFSIIVSTLLLSFEVINQSKMINHSYLDVARNMGLNGIKLYSKVAYKSIQPSIFAKLQRIHYYLWVLIMIYEFIGRANGIGSVYFYALSYRDFAALFSFALIISILILLGDIILKFINEKIFAWE
ncbi:MAG: ABC transporter permease subunit [Bacteroidota bacterium]